MGVGMTFTTRNGQEWVVLNWMMCSVLNDIIVVAERIKHYNRRMTAAANGVTIQVRAEIFVESNILENCTEGAGTEVRS